jgi:hypothetical protein
VLLFSLFLSTSVATSNAFYNQNNIPVAIKEGNLCYIDNDNAYISATPHTLYAAGMFT